MSTTRKDKGLLIVRLRKRASEESSVAETYRAKGYPGADYRDANGELLGLAADIIEALPPDLQEGGSS